jgi:cysteine-rich secretory family protein/hemolysin type calcium-binding protein
LPILVEITGAWERRLMCMTMVENLESRVLFAFNPTPREQELLEMVNRMRTNPAGELKLLIHSTDKDTNESLDFFNVNQTVLAQQFAKLKAVPPLAWNAELRNAAITHSKAMLAADEQSHQVSGEAGLADRIDNAGYHHLSSAGENVFAYATNMFHAHASFAIDWGDDVNGIQNPPGHRDNMMSAAYREVGIGLVDAPAGHQTGPILVTQDFASHYNFGNPWFLGAVYNDKNHNGAYNAGEGISGATITLNGASGKFSATSMSAGGYQVRVPGGAYSVTAKSPQFGGTITLSSVTVGSQNVKRDFRPDMVKFASLAENIVSIEGTSGNDSISITRSGDTIRVQRNANLQTFSLATVGQFNINSGDGNDTIDFSGIDITTYVNAGTGNDSVQGGGGYDTITGGAGKDTIFGGDGDDRINGNGTHDKLYGEGGNDRLYGGAGNDTLEGGSGVDRLFGGDGNDSLAGGSSNDKLYGEAGNDTLNGQRGTDLFDGGAGTDSAKKDHGERLTSIESILA